MVGSLTKITRPQRKSPNQSIILKVLRIMVNVFLNILKIYIFNISILKIQKYKIKIKTKNIKFFKTLQFNHDTPFTNQHSRKKEEKNKWPIKPTRPSCPIEWNKKTSTILYTGIPLKYFYKKINFFIFLF